MKLMIPTTLGRAVKLIYPGKCYRPLALRNPTLFARQFSSTSNFRQLQQQYKLKQNGKTEDKPVYGRYIVGGLFAALITGCAVNKDLRQNTIDVFLIAERVGVVTVATVRCFGLYLKTLNKNYDSDDEYAKELSKTHKKASQITLKALEKNGGIYIKLGQHVSAMTYLLPFEWTETMVTLQDKCPESTLEEIKEMFELDIGSDFDSYFSEFNPEPIGVASLAQVHTATIRSTGQQVAVKLQHPSLSKFVPLDILLTKTVFDLMYKVFPEYPLTWLGDELQQSIYVELNFVNEAENAKKTDDYFKAYQKLTALRIPKVYEALPRILIMEFVGGARLDNLEYIDKHNISRAEVSSCLSHIFNNMIFQSGFVHCDPHHGNIAIRALDKKVDGKNFEIVLYDHGLYRTIPKEMKIDYSKFWLALLEKEPDQMQKYGTRFAKIDDDKFPIFAAAITGRDFDHALTGDVTTAREENEIINMRESLMKDSTMFDLMSLLASVPRIVLLILKTNDLTRHLDESLKNPLGQERTFLILVSYCAGTVYQDEKESISKRFPKWSIKWCFGEFGAWWKYMQRSCKLYAYDFAFYVNNIRKSTF